MEEKILEALWFHLEKHRLAKNPDENDCVQFVQSILDLVKSLGSTDINATVLIEKYWEDAKPVLRKRANENDFYGNKKEIEKYLKAVIQVDLGAESSSSYLGAYLQVDTIDLVSG